MTNHHVTFFMAPEDSMHISDPTDSIRYNASIEVSSVDHIWLSAEQAWRNFQLPRSCWYDRVRTHPLRSGDMISIEATPRKD